MIKDRLVLLKRLLSKEGAIIVNLDDTEMAYCKVMMDEIFDRKNYITTVVVEAATPSSSKTFNIGPTQVAQYLLIYAKEKSLFNYHQQYILKYEIDLEHFSRFIVNLNDPPSEWQFQSINDHILTRMGFEGDSPNAKWAAARRELGSEVAKEEVRQRAIDFALENCDRVFETKTLQKPSKWLHEHIRTSRISNHVIELKRDRLDSIYLYKGRQLYFLGKGVQELDGERVVTEPVSNIWMDIPTNNLKKEGGVDFPAGKKPEELLRRVIQMICDCKDDIVLDSFAGSGTTGAVAHKLGYRWIMAELGEHCHTHIIPRLKKVIDGKDPGGITKTANWQGGGGFRYYRLGPSLIVEDAWGNPVINPEFNAAMLAEAMCKLEGFTYAPSEEVFWMHGHSTEQGFIYVTTQFMSKKMLTRISDEVGPNRSLLICCTVFRCDPTQFPNLTLKKIPNAVLTRCEWGKDDYSLAVANLPAKPLEPGTQTSLFEETEA
jgi:adenine-specific DNA-methyltransferase